MKRISVLTIALAVVAAVPAQAQLINFPVHALPSANGAPATFLAASYGRGLSDGSGKLDSYGAFVGRTGIGGRATISAGAGMIDAAESEWTFGGAVGIDVMPAGGSAQVSIQTGVGYFSPVTDVSNLHIPIGVALKGNIEGPTATVVPWIMPRLSIFRASNPVDSETNTEFGASGGVAFTMPSGFGAHTALDLLATDPSSWLLGVGIHFMIP